jgi:cysteinyl-tRNA synthetase
MFKAIFVLVFVIFSSCDKDDNPEDGIDYKQEMRDFVIGISQYSKSLNQDFIVIPQNGIELVTDNGEEPDNGYCIFKRYRRCRTRRFILRI